MDLSLTPEEQEKIQAMADKATEHNGHFHGMTYEEGVTAALEWVLGRTDGDPMEGV